MAEHDAILIVKTAALGDVLRTTSILPGIQAKFPRAKVTWVTAPAARDLCAWHPLVATTLTVDARDAKAVDALIAKLKPTRFRWIISLDDEEPLCRLASALSCEKLSGAHLAKDGSRTYTDDVEPWFGMGLLAKAGKAAADRRKIENVRSHPAIYAAMLGVAMGRPALPLPPAAVAFAEQFAKRQRLDANGPVIGLNTGAGSRWKTKELRLDELVELVAGADRELDNEVTFLLLGGQDERERNAEVLRRLAALKPAPRVIDGGCDNALLDFAALIGRCDLLLTSDSLALHLAVAAGIRLVAFFAPTSAAEIELYGLGEKLASTSPDYCSYRVDADNRTITAERLLPLVLTVLARPPGPAPRR